ncbi:MAG: hypothetical protein J6V00_05180 [Bacteroidaceae bacterium]|nr:hypothetical protein [Bacteroidaceae bacterium]
MERKRLIPKSRAVFKQNAELDTVKRAKSREGRAMDILMEAQVHWTNMDKFRRDRERNKRYAYGDQWKDIVTVDGKTMTEEQYILEQGNIPLKNNLIRRLLRNMLGAYRMQTKEPLCVARDRDEQQLGETMSAMLQYNGQLNMLQGLYARGMEEFLISGLIAHKKWFGWNSKRDKSDCWTDPVDPSCFFVDNNMKDFRTWDVSFIGEIHDVSFEDLCGQFAHSPGDYARLTDIYRMARDKELVINNYSDFGYTKPRNDSFLFPTDLSKCRVIEVWKLESKPRIRCRDYNTGELYKIDIEDYEELVVRENAERHRQAREVGMPDEDVPEIVPEWFYDSFWYRYYLTPFGDILEEGETPYEHKSHPYVFKMYPFIDGEIHSFVADVIDQQRYTNRLITLYDWIMRASAKGVLLFPEECLPDGTSLEDIAENWARFDGVIAIKAKAGVPLPQQISNNSTNIGITELLNLQLKLFEDISGVNGALQGKQGYSGMSASLYAQQAQNASTSLLDLFETYSEFVIDAAYKDVKNIQQSYDRKKIFNIAGRKAEVVYDPEKIRDVEFDLSIVESNMTPVFRERANELLMELFKAKAINVEQLLESGSFPFADELLQSIRNQQQAVQNGQMPQGLPPELMAQVQQGADMMAVNRAQQLLAA